MLPQNISIAYSLCASTSTEHREYSSTTPHIQHNLPLDKFLVAHDRCMVSICPYAVLDHSLVDAEMGVGLEVDAVVLFQRSRRLYPRCRRRLPGGGDGGEARATAPEGGVAVEVRWQHGEMMRREERTERLGGDFWAESEGALGCRLPPCASAFPSWVVLDRKSVV